MDKDELTNAEPANRQSSQTSRLAYMTPELIAYNHSAITMGGAKSVIGDFVPGGGTSYKS